MIVMPSNNTCWLVHYFAGRYGNVGHLYGPARSENPQPHLPYGLDNGAFGAFVNNRPWDREAFLSHVERYAFLGLRPLFVVVPDVVADAELTLARWKHWAPVLADQFHLKLALAVQDGMTTASVESLNPEPDLLFVGGSTEWKWKTMPEWCKVAPRVHVGRVNGKDGLEACAEAGAESCDGTGWFRGHVPQIVTLARFLAEQAGFDMAKEGPWIEYIVRNSRLKGRAQSVLPLADVS